MQKTYSILIILVLQTSLLFSCSGGAEKLKSLTHFGGAEEVKLQLNPDDRLAIIAAILAQPHHNNEVGYGFYLEKSQHRAIHSIAASLIGLKPVTLISPISPDSQVAMVQGPSNNIADLIPEKNPDSFGLCVHALPPFKGSERILDGEGAGQAEIFNAFTLAEKNKPATIFNTRFFSSEPPLDLCAYDIIEATDRVTGATGEARIPNKFNDPYTIQFTKPEDAPYQKHHLVITSCPTKEGGDTSVVKVWAFSPEEMKEQSDFDYRRRHGLS